VNFLIRKFTWHFDDLFALIKIQTSWPVFWPPLRIVPPQQCETIYTEQFFFFGDSSTSTRVSHRITWPEVYVYEACCLLLTLRDLNGHCGTLLILWICLSRPIEGGLLVVERFFLGVRLGEQSYTNPTKYDTTQLYYVPFPMLKV